MSVAQIPSSSGFQDLCQITRRVHSDHEASAAQAHRSGTKLGSGLKARANSDLKLKALCWALNWTSDNKCHSFPRSRRVFRKWSMDFSRLYWALVQTSVSRIGLKPGLIEKIVKLGPGSKNRLVIPLGAQQHDFVFLRTVLASCYFITIWWQPRSEWTLLNTSSSSSPSHTLTHTHTHTHTHTPTHTHTHTHSDAHTRTYTHTRT